METRNTSGMEPPSKGAIARATVIALAVALVILFTAVLPAEYGIDPLKTGAALGLTDLSKTREAKAASPTVTAAAPAPPAPVKAGVYTAQPTRYKIDTEDMTLRPGDGVEIKYHMQKGAVMVYSWKANGNLRFEFHGEPDQKPNKDYYESYELDDKVGRDHSYGSFTAPTTGIHGWFWENKGGKEVEMHLTTAGFYDSAKMYAGDAPEELPIEDPK